MSEPGYRSEPEVLALWGIDPESVEHCSSCHCDAGDGYSMSNAMAPDGEWEDVCCGASTAISKEAAKDE